ERDDPGVVDHLDHDGDVSRALDDLVVVVVKAGEHRRAGCGPEQATLLQAAAFRAVRGTHAAAGFGSRSLAGLPIGGERRDATVRRINDQRSSARTDYFRAAIVPGVVISKADVLFGSQTTAAVGIVGGDRTLLVIGGFFRGKDFFTGE